MKLYLELLFLAAVWGASFLFLRIGSPEFGPVALIFVRTAVAAIVLLPIVLYQGNFREITQNFWVFFAIGLLSTALPFCLFAYTSLHLTAGYTSILNATTPFFSAIITHFWLDEKIHRGNAIGLLLGFFGVYLLTMDRQNGLGTVIWFPIMSALGATFLYAASSCYVKLKMSNFSAVGVALGSQLFSAALLAPLAYLYWPNETPSSLAWGSAVAMGVFSTALALIIFFQLIHRVGVTKTVAVTYLIPVFGMLWGYLFLSEPITLIMLLGGMVVLLGVSFTTGLVRVFPK